MIKGILIGGAVAAAAAAAFAVPPTPMGGKDVTRGDVVAKVHDHFARLDANKDGVIDQAEIAKMSERRMEKRVEKMGDPNQAFDRMDTNKDGSISRDEFAKGRQIRIEKRIVMKDGSGHAMPSPDGKPMPHDMHMMHGGHGMGGHMIAMADGNHDGKITLAEAETMALKHFDEMDSNKDGKVTAEERKAARPMMMKMREIHTEHAPTAS